MTLFPLFGKAYEFELAKATTLNGVKLDPGIYKLTLNSPQTKAEIWAGSRLTATARVEVKPLGNSTKNTIVIRKNGTLSEYRSEREKIRFTDSASQNLSSGH